VNPPLEQGLQSLFRANKFATTTVQGIELSLIFTLKTTSSARFQKDKEKPREVMVLSSRGYYFKRKPSYDPAYFSLYFFLNRSTRPAVSINRCFPVKKGWQAEQISTLILSTVERVSKEFPQAQTAVALPYFG
jgi:hypothetical protein